MRIILGWIFVLILAGSVRAAEPVSLNLKFPQLVLQSGETLSDATIKSYDYLNGSVSVLAGKTLRKIEMGNLPDDVRQKIERLGPKLTDEQKEKLIAKDDAAAEKARLREERKAVVTRPAPMVRSIPAPAGPSDATNPAQLMALKNAANTYASHYIRYDYAKWSNIGAVTNVDLLLDEPEVVSGWPGRWRVKGKVGFNYLTNQGSTVVRESRSVDVILEAAAGGQPKLVDVSVH
ncbi:MAG TPA: hypothetical protein VHD32_06665 [Candidatus Didemnitutus sp.]|nr:hypothetical protein [Candidatus Didemnitutus sp.]